MKEYTIFSEIEGSIATIWLNRPGKQNALNYEMLSSFLTTLRYLESMPPVRIILIRGKGKAFCAGADLEWMYSASSLSYEENYRECEMLARCFYEIYTSKKIIVCMVHGSCMGGGNGFVSAADIAIADSSAVFAFSEVRLGLIPVTILPYILQKTSKGFALEKMLSGSVFGAYEAQQNNLITREVKSGQMSKFWSELSGELLKGDVMAQQMIKLIIKSSNNAINETLIVETAKALADARTKPEAIEGMHSFLIKRKSKQDKELSKST